MPLALDKLILAAHKDKSIEAILDLPTSALKGVSEGDAQHLDDAFGIKSIRDMADNKFFRAATALLMAGTEEGYDPGPPPFWVDKLGELPDDYYVSHPSGRFRVHFGGVPYRGRLDDTARVVCVGQDPSTDESIARRAFVGDAGQRLQKLLHKIGITRSYVIINTFAYSINGTSDTEMENIAQEPQIKSYREELLNTLIDKNPVEAIITFGSGARKALATWNNPEGIPVFNLFHPSARFGLADSWNGQLAALSGTITPDDAAVMDLTPYDDADWDLPSQRMSIPRFDLPFNIPHWHGTSGTNSERGPNRTTEITWTSIL